MIRLAVWILNKTLWLAVICTLTIVGIPASILVLACGLSLAFVALMLAAIPLILFGFVWL